MPRLLILTFAALAFGANTFTIVGLLTELADAQGVGVPAAAQVQTAFVLTAAVAGPLLAVATRRLDRRTVLTASLALLALTAFVSAATSSFGGLLAARAAAGLSGALVLPLATAAAAGLAAPEKRGAAVATVLLGMTLALLAAAPACTAIGAALGWPAAFVFAGILAGLAAILVRTGLPALPGAAGGAAALGRAAIARLAPLWTTTLFSFTAAFSLTSFMSPIAGRLAGATGEQVGLFQMAIGIGSLCGILLGGRFADRGAGLGALAAGLAAVAAGIGAPALAFAATSGPSGFGALCLAGGLLLSATALFGLMPIVQARLAQGAGPAAPLALALNGSANFAGQAGGAVLGGAAIAAAGLPAAPLTGAAVALAGAALLLWLGRSRRVIAPTLPA